MTIVNVREVTRGGRILGDFFPYSNRVTFLMGGGGGGFFHRRERFCSLLRTKMTIIRPHSLSVEKSGYTHGQNLAFSRICKLYIISS